MTSVKNIALLDRKDNTLGQLNRRNIAGLFVLGTLLANLPKNLPISWEVINSNLYLKLPPLRLNPIHKKGP